MGSVELQRVEHVDDQRLGERTQRVHIVESRGEGIAEAAARAVEQQAPEPAQARDQWSPARAAGGGAVDEHGRRPLTDLLDANRDTDAVESQPLLGWGHATRLPEASLRRAVAHLVHCKLPW